MEAFVDALLKPGTGYKVLPIANVSLVLLLCVLLASAIRWSESAVVVHFGVMAVLALLLLGTVNWFVHELKKTKKDE